MPHGTKIMTPHGVAFLFQSCLLMFQPLIACAGDRSDNSHDLCLPPDLQGTQVDTAPGASALQCQGHDSLLQGGH